MHGHLSGVPAVDAEDGPGDLRAPGADQARETDDLAVPDVEGDVGEDALAGQPAHAQGDLARLDLLFGVQLVEVAADHATHEVVLGHALQGLAGDPGAVAQGGDPPADLEDLLQPVGDEQHGGALFAQGAYDAEEAGDLAAGEGGGRLVHDQDAGVEGEGLGDLDDLLVGDGQAARGAVGVEFDAEALHQRGGRVVRGLVVDPAEGTARLAAHVDVLGDRQVGEERGLLVDHGDAGVAGVAGAVEGHGRAVEQHLAGVRPVHSGERLDEGGLAGTVLTGQGMHLPGEQLQGDVPQGADRPEGLRDVLQCQNRGRTRGGRVGHGGSSTTPTGPPLGVLGVVKGFNWVAGTLGGSRMSRQWVPVEKVSKPEGHTLVTGNRLGRRG